jgi:hypothetical protein
MCKAQAWISGLMPTRGRRENGNRVLDVVELDEHGQAARVRAFYQDAQQ